MTTAQIKYCLETYGNQVNVWIPGDEMKAICCIALIQDSTIFVKPNIAFRFNTTNECLEMVYGMKNRDGIFVDEDGNFTNDTIKPFNYQTFELIQGFSVTEFCGEAALLKNTYEWDKLDKCFRP